jgi:hypothetical protein
MFIHGFPDPDRMDNFVKAQPWTGERAPQHMAHPAEASAPVPPVNPDAIR